LRYVVVNLVGQRNYVVVAGCAFVIVIFIVAAAAAGAAVLPALFAS